MHFLQVSNCTEGTEMYKFLYYSDLVTEEVLTGSAN